MVRNNFNQEAVGKNRIFLSIIFCDVCFFFVKKMHKGIKRKNYDGNNLNAAIRSVQSGEHTPFKASKIYNVPATTLYDKMKGYWLSTKSWPHSLKNHFKAKIRYQRWQFYVWKLELVSLTYYVLSNSHITVRNESHF